MRWLIIGSFFMILVALILINAKVNGGFKIEMSWVAIALSPLVLWLVSTNQLAEFSGFGLAFKLKEASSRPFSLTLEGDRINPVPIPLGEKSGLAEIPSLVEQRVEALTLQLNRQGYYSNFAIEEYLQELTQHNFFHYVVFIRGNETFYGLMDAKLLLKEMRRRNGLDLVKIVEAGNVQSLPGLVTAFVKKDESKRAALQKMDENSLSTLPVVDADGKLVGTVDRGKLTSSIVLQLVAK